MTCLLWGYVVCWGFLAQASAHLAKASGSLARDSGCIGFNVCTQAVAPLAA